jgi:signal transduction histidine kinase
VSVEPDFKLLFESVPEPHLVLSPDFRVLAASESYLAVTMTVRERILGRSIFEVFPDNPDDEVGTGSNNLRASLERVIATRRPDTMAVQRYDIPRPEALGGGFEKRFWSPRNMPVLGPDGAVRYVMRHAEDVTEFVRLSAREDVESALRTRMGQMEAEIIQRSQDLQTTNARLRAAEEATRLANAQLERRVEERTVALTAANAALVAEAEERKRVEAQFLQAQKMEAIGQLAGGVAHDFNNLLTIILSLAGMVKDDLGAGHPAVADLQEIELAGERAATLTHQLLAFSRKQAVNPVPLDLNDVVTESEKLLRRLIGENIRVVTSLGAQLGTVEADQALVGQVLMNLFVNARDAMPDGGTLTVETANVTREKDEPGLLGAPPGDYVMFAVRDTGMGMDEATREQIFLPFFTTKGVGKGTGLGLSMVHGVVKQSGGELVVESEIGRGTTFRIFLPRVAPPTAPLLQTPRREAMSGSERILLVEDDPAIRHVAERALQKAGFEVSVAASADEAERLCAEMHPHLLVSDVVMPEVDGPTIAAQLKTLHPNLRVLFMSGYTRGALTRHGLVEAGVGFLPKPFTADVLVARVRQVLDA